MNIYKWDLNNSYNDDGQILKLHYNLQVNIHINGVDNT